MTAISIYLFSKEQRGSMGKLGRPVGYSLSDASKAKIAKSKTGVLHTQETRDKISTGLLNYFKNKDKLSDELLKYYPEEREWIMQNADLINNDEDGDHLYTGNQIQKRHYKLTLFEDDWMTSGDPIDPEILLLKKEELELEALMN